MLIFAEIFMKEVMTAVQMQLNAELFGALQTIELLKDIYREDPMIQIHRLNRYLYHRSKLNGHPAAKLQIISVLLVILIGQNCDSIHIIIILSYSCVI